MSSIADFEFNASPLSEGVITVSQSVRRDFPVADVGASCNSWWTKRARRCRSISLRSSNWMRSSNCFTRHGIRRRQRRVPPVGRHLAGQGAGSAAGDAGLAGHYLPAYCQRAGSAAAAGDFPHSADPARRLAGRRAVADQPAERRNPERAPAGSVDQGQRGWAPSWKTTISTSRRTSWWCARCSIR